MNKETAKSEIKKLIQKYETVKTDGRINDYKEEMTKKDFILPLFRALGWDVENSNEVSAEDSISGGRVDYSFKLGGIVKFFVEAKPLKADLNNSEYIKQAINYSWHKGVQWAVLTDFEGLKLYNAEWKEDFDKAKALNLTCTDYIADFDSLWLLSKESILSGQLDKWSEKFGKKTKKQPVSKQILDDLLKAREKLTKNIQKYPRLNKISETELDEAIQRMLDRLIFIRTCEDRGIEQNHLLSAVRNKKQSLGDELKKIFRDFDDGYNSKLFEPHLCEKLTIDNDVLEEIILSLYQTQDGNIHYDFGAINADVLGSIYEQYLGHILKKTSATAKLKETHQHRKEQGIYYTPIYIVDYIVKNTVGEILKTAKPKTVQKIKILDPACGSGSFLIRAFDELVKYWAGELGGVRKPEILQNNIYGVDLDKQAVEITQMNLLLKTLYTRERLPMLKNIRCGNSLIDDPKIAGNKAFKWEEEFPFIRHSEAKPKNPACHSERSEESRSEESQNGFDIIIGNPPYVQSRNITDDRERKFYWEKYLTDTNHSDVFSFFIQKAIILLKNNGYLGFILPNTWLQLPSFLSTRKFILDNCVIEKIVTFDSNIKVFQDAVVEPLIMVVRKLVKKKHTIFHEKYFNPDELPKQINKIPQESFKKFYTFDVSLNTEKYKIISKVLNLSSQLPQIVKIVGGLRTGDDRKYLKNSKQNNDDRKLLRGRNIGRYSYVWNGEWVWYRPDLMKKRQCAAPKDAQLFEVPEKLLMRMITGKQIISTYDNNQFYLLQDNILLPKEKNYNIKYVLAILNSTLLNFFIKSISSNIAITQSMLKQLPIRKINFSKLPEKKLHDDLVLLAQKMLDLNKQLQKFGDKITDERKRLESEIQKTDNQIDEMVYKLYGLTAEEIKIVERN